MERICEMGQVMRRAVQVDDEHYCSVREKLAQLEVRRRTVLCWGTGLTGIHYTLSRNETYVVLTKKKGKHVAGRRVHADGCMFHMHARGRTRNIFRF